MFNLLCVLIGIHRNVVICDVRQVRCGLVVKSPSRVPCEGRLVCECGIYVSFTDFMLYLFACLFISLLDFYKACAKELKYRISDYDMQERTSTACRPDEVRGSLPL